MKLHHAIAMLMTSSLLTACGGGSTAGGGAGGGGNAPATSDTFTVERGPLLFTNLLDAHGFPANSLGNGNYAFTNNVPVYPLKTTGGYIDVNRNGIIDAGDVKAGELSLRSLSTGLSVTLASTIANNSAIKDKLITLGFTESQLAYNLPSNDKMIAALSDEIYAYWAKNPSVDLAQLSVEAFNSLTPAIQTRISQYQASTATATQLEQVLVTELNANLNEQLVSETLDTANQSNLITVLNSLPVYALTETQIHSLHYMWNEEKLAKELYLALNAVYPTNSLKNIATNAETQHVGSMEALLAKYSQTQSVIDSYNQAHPTTPITQLSEMPAGVFTLPELQTLYDTLYREGIASATASLQAGCKVEVTDVTDLDQDILDAGSAKDLVTFFEILRAGSYNHYWSFDNALKKAGVANGCLSAGVDGSRFPDTSTAGGGKP